MTIEEFAELMDEDNYDYKACNDIKDDHTIVGLNIIRKYLLTAGISGAGHDIIYSVDAEELIDAGITEEDVKLLRNLGWMYSDGEYLAHFV